MGALNSTVIILLLSRFWLFVIKENTFVMVCTKEVSKEHFVQSVQLTQQNGSGNT